MLPTPFLLLERGFFSPNDQGVALVTARPHELIMLAGIDPTTRRPAPTPARRDLASRLARARVLVVGAGGLGAPAAAYLAASGVGTIGLLDPDHVELSNLHRQLLHRDADVGRSKVASARATLRALAPGIAIEAVPDRLDRHNAARFVAAYDFVIDGSDGFATKFLINDAAVAAGVPFSHGGVTGFLGQTLTVIPGASACYRCLFSAPPAPGDVPSCQEAGILGPVSGVIGTIQAAQAVACLGGGGALLLDRLLTYDALATRWRTVRIRSNPSCPACTRVRAAQGGERKCSDELRE
jgi:molybdopterin/thiamine biosynthesis adenylyltransferase